MLGLFSGLSVFGCGSDDELPEQYLGDTSDPGGGALEPLRPNADDPWWCLGEGPPLFPQQELGKKKVGFVAPVVEWTTLTSLAGRGLMATLCPGVLFNCATPLAPPSGAGDGLLGPPLPLPPGWSGIAVPEGFDGIIKWDVASPPGTPEEQGFIPVSYYLPSPARGDVTVGPTILLLQRRDRDMLFQQSFPALNPAIAQAAGTVVSGVVDCNGLPASNVRVEIAASGQALDGVTRFSLPSSRIPLAVPMAEPLVTGASGQVGFVGVPPGAVQLRAFRPYEAQPFGTTELGTVPGQISVGSIRPPNVELHADCASGCTY
jgi:hypothetical protein